MNQEENVQQNVSTKSKEYKEECRQLLERIVALQLKVFKAPDLYVKEVLNVVELYKQQFELVKQNPGQSNGKFSIIAQFLSKVAVYYKTDMKFYIEDLMELINHFQNTLNQGLRKRIIFCLLRLRGKNLIEPYRMIVFLMKLFNCQDKDLRRIIFRFIIKDIKQFNKKHRNETLNKQIQNFIIDLIKKSQENIAKRAIQIMIELYRKNIWKDNKCVNIIAQGCFNQNYKIKLLACYFLIETTETHVEVESSEDEADKYIQKKGKNKCVKPTKAREHRVEREKKMADKKQRKKLQRLSSSGGFFALDQIYSPQDFAERLFDNLKKHDSERFSVKLAMMHLISRLIHRHKLLLIPFYTYIQKHLYPNSKDVAKLFAYLAESIHDQIPKEDLQPTIRHLIDQFVNDRCQELTLTMGLRGIYEILQKHPKILDKENITYLIHYIKYKNRNVSQAARSILNHFKDTNPQLLDKRLRGSKWKSTEELDGEFDDNFIQQITVGIDGADLLQQEEEEKLNKKFDIPIYCDRILTDDDFKRIRALKRKKEAEIEQNKLQDKQKNQYIEQEEEDEDEEDFEDDDENDQDDISDISGDSAELDDNENENEEWEDESIEDEDIDEDIDDDDIKPDSKITKEQNKKRRQSLSDLEEDSVQEFYSDESQVSDENPHGYVREEDIMRYRKTKSEQKHEKLEELKNGTKEKWYQGPNKKKSEFASTSNKEKQKNKPLQMMRAKKVEQKNKESRIKSKIKDLKNKLGHVRSGKQAQRLKKQKLK
ncbi:unnamed protein product (macronuclear) [Paramecium tetraurelia]|uniref:Protein SDA1 n=1 Tax=Paramecium tetraurelia TaxID=5888 RepID=A0BP73_PARTE|nr:uncharacterized protein GSPATT00005089001 [Paramecium tetraurelia]CAK60340.1 unnamed protein product [Paramecium tetraurelia]|eukprot:XP_001427738.1 hypothetical protein (macronuclear) [Paramecium tetraurelia strain d4-2]